MHELNFHSLIRSLATILLMSFSAWIPSTVWAKCSRLINVPVSPTGLSAITHGEMVRGIFPDLLRDMEEKSACSFSFPVVARARQEAMFEAGTADLLITSIQNARRDALGQFVPMVQIRATLISLPSKRAAISNMQELSRQREVRLVLVRGYDYGPDYQQLISDLSRQGRIFLVPDPLAVAKVLQASPDRATIMAPSIFTGTLEADPRFAEMSSKLRFEPLDELPWTQSGTYLSKISVNPADKMILLDLLEKAAMSGQVWRAYQRHYSSKVVKLSLRPLAPAREIGR